MKGPAYTLYAPYLQLRRLSLRYREIFPPMDGRIYSLMVPPGWIDILRLAAEDAAACSEMRVQVRTMHAQADTLKVDFIAGNETARAAFMAMLDQTREHCPCCGALWSPEAKMRVFG